ncbi:MAG: DUF4255 domain-containing protein [Desulfobacterales bacterium]|nr:DUF4255 domain-containing protein [Desulfobacterales bacterium]
MRRPQAALDLFYLVSFFGDADALEPDRMLGAAVRDLHARPLLDRQAITDAIAGRPALATSDLAAAVERVKFTPVAMTLDEMSRLWSVMTQTPHAVGRLPGGRGAARGRGDATGAGAGAAPRPRRPGRADRAGAAPAITATWIGTALAFAASPRPRRSRAPAWACGWRSAPAASAATRWPCASCTRAAGPSTSRCRPRRSSATNCTWTRPRRWPAPPGWTAGVYAVSLRVTRDGRTRVSGEVPLALAPRLTSITPSPAALRRRPARSSSRSAASRRCGRASSRGCCWTGSTRPCPRSRPTPRCWRFPIADAPVVADALVRLRVADVATGDTPRRRAWTACRSRTTTRPAPSASTRRSASRSHERPRAVAGRQRALPGGGGRGRAPAPGPAGAAPGR